MSPEQALGKTLDVRSDLYSVGVMLYEMVTGLLPFDAESFMGILTQHITAKLVPPTQVAPDRLIPATLEALIIKALAKEPEDRFSSMGELKAALLEVAAVESPSLHEAWQRRDSGEGRIPSARMLSSKSGDSARPASGEVAAASPALGLGDRGEAARSPATAPAREASRGEAKPPAAAPSVPEAGKPEAIAAPRGEVTLPDDLTPAGSERYRVVAVIAVLAVAIGGLALALSLRARPPAVPASVSGAAVGSAPAPAANTIGVIVDSEPAGAKILIGGRAVGETPEVVPVPLGGKVEITLRREGHEDKVLLLDSSRAKVSVRLERRDRRRPAGASPERPTTKPIAAPRAPSPPPPGLAAPTQRPSTIAVPPPARPPVSPIEPSPRRRPGTATSAPEVLDPYQ